jgi:ABC-type lipoprotein release transport system permease subunit
MIITMGGSKLFIFGLVLAETMILAIIGAAIGVTVSSLIFYSFREFIAFTLKIPYIWPSIPGVFLFGGVITAIAVIVGIVASLYPAFQASSIEPSEELWRGEF